MPMYWTFNRFLGCIYTVYYIVHIVVLVLNWLSNLEFRLPKKEDQVARIGVMGGGLGDSGNAPKKTLFFRWPLPLYTIVQHKLRDVPSFCLTNSSQKYSRNLGIRGFHSWEWPGTRIHANPWSEGREEIGTEEWTNERTGSLREVQEERSPWTEKLILSLKWAIPKCCWNLRCPVLSPIDIYH